MTHPRSPNSRPVLSALLAFGPALALAATLAVAPGAEAAPKCNYKPAACKLQEQRAEQRKAEATTASAAAPTPGTANLLCSSKSAVCDQQKRAAAQAASVKVTPAAGEKIITPQKCNLKPAACWLEERRSAQ